MRRRTTWIAFGLLAAAASAILASSLASSGRRHAAGYGVASSGPGYGIATAGANLGVSEPVATCLVPRVPCPAAKLRLADPFGGGSPAANAFGAFRRQVLAAPGRTGYLRLWIAYDALYAWNPAARACGWSPYAFGPRARFNGVNGMMLFGQLVWDIQGARALGLSPEVVFSAGSGEGAPSYPDPGYGDPSALFAGVTTAGSDYYCGVLGIVGWLRTYLGPAAPTEWEAFNEPDTKSQYMGSLRNGCARNGSCGVPPPGVGYDRGGYLCGRPYAGCGALEAAELWELARGAVERQGPTSKRVAAATLTEPETPYLDTYAEQLRALASCAAGFVPVRDGPCATAGLFPRYWAVHDYDDPTAGGTADLRSFELALSRLAPRRYRPLDVWVTESGVELGSQTPADLNRRGCSAPPGRDPTLGACVDDNAARQALGARVWGSLLGLRAPGVRTTQVYWFEFALIPSWDSALVDASGRARPSFCALVPGTRCDGNPTDYLLSHR